MIKAKVISFLFDLLKESIAYSYWICLLTCIVATILYVSGLRKAGRYVPATLVIYFLLECLKDTIGEYIK